MLAVIIPLLVILILYSLCVVSSRESRREERHPWFYDTDPSDDEV